MKKILLLIGCCSLIVTSGYAQGGGRSAFLADSLNEYINRALTYWRIPGAAVCIIKDGKVVLMKGYGIRELGLNDRVTDNTLFMIGDNTKGFTAAALQTLQAIGKLNLDDKVTRFLPEFKTQDKIISAKATIRDVLTQQLGFENNAGNFTFYNTNLSADQVVQKMALLPQPGGYRNKWDNANAYYALAGEIIPWASGQTWDAFVRTHIFDPLNMNNTLALSRDIAIAQNKAVPHTIVDGRLTAIPYARLDAMDAAGGISSSINDLSKWVMALLNDGNVNNRQVLPAGILKAVEASDVVSSYLHRINKNGGDGLLFQDCGMGWMEEKYNNHKVVLSDGRINGYQSSITIVPDEHLGIIVLTNTDRNRLSEALRYLLMDVYANASFYDYNEDYLNGNKNIGAKNQQIEKRYRDSVAYNLQPTMTIDSYMGKYHNNLYGDAFVTRGEGYDLEMRFEHHPKMYAKLQPLGGNRFYATFSDPLYGKSVFAFAFQGGRITGVTVRVDAEVEKTPYYFSKAD